MQGIGHRGTRMYVDTEARAHMWSSIKRGLCYRPQYNRNLFACDATFKKGHLILGRCHMRLYRCICLNVYMSPRM